VRTPAGHDGAGWCPRTSSSKVCPMKGRRLVAVAVPRREPRSRSVPRRRPGGSSTASRTATARVRFSASTVCLGSKPRPAWSCAFAASKSGLKRYPDFEARRSPVLSPGSARPKSAAPRNDPRPHSVKRTSSQALAFPWGTTFTLAYRGTHSVVRRGLTRGVPRTGARVRGNFSVGCVFGLLAADARAVAVMAGWGREGVLACDLVEGRRRGALPASKPRTAGGDWPRRGCNARISASPGARSSRPLTLTPTIVATLGLHPAERLLNQLERLALDQHIVHAATVRRGVRQLRGMRAAG